jgi:2,4-dienoyl-CoA reductase-like NADH-dependent reductase (Old Yellow Enzyme family)
MSLFEPFTLGSHTLRNRVMLAPMTTYSSYEDGRIREDELAYLERRASGGLGAIITAACYVHSSGHAFVGQWGCDRDELIPSLRSAVEAIHRGGAKAVLQIHHGGRQCPPVLAGGECISASAVPYPREGAAVPREMTEFEIERTIADFAAATRRARLAGFDGVEIHGANTYLIQQFVSHESNRRSDKWNAADLEFPKRLVEAVLSERGEMFIGYRFSPEEAEVQGGEVQGIRLEHTYRLLDVLCNSGIDFLHISLRHFAQPSLFDEHSPAVMSLIHDFIAGRKPLVGVGSIKQPEDGVLALSTGCEMVAIGRVGVSEPEWVERCQTGGSIRTMLPAGDFAAELTVPRGLVDKIHSVPGWFEIS